MTLIEAKVGFHLNIRFTFMNNSMFTTRTNIKIGRSVIGFHFIDMMYYFTITKIATNNFFNYKTVFKNTIMFASERMRFVIGNNVSMILRSQMKRFAKFCFMFFGQFTSLWSWGRLKFTGFPDFFFRCFRVWMTFFSLMEKSKTDTRAKFISFSVRGFKKFFTFWTNFNHTASIAGIGYYGNIKTWQ